ncbi:hypothetical protein vseg_001243 [Gypsophila vaccaria]
MDRLENGTQQHWTNEEHSKYLSLMEATFVRTMLVRSYVKTSDNNDYNNRNNDDGGMNDRLDRFVPDITESTLDSKARKFATPAVITNFGNTQIQRRPSCPYKISPDQPDQVVPEIEDKASDKADN